MVARVLLVEDEFLIREILAEALEDAGFGVWQAEDGDAAADLIDISDEFDLVVTDIQMPGHLDGVRLGRRIRLKQPGIPIIYTTGRPEAMKEVARLGPHDVFVAKPYGPSEIVGIANRMLQGRSERCVPGESGGYNQ